MRPTVLLLSLAVLGLGATAAQANLTLPVDQEIGTLTCQTRAPARALGTTPVADCSFVSDRDGVSQSFVAVLGKRVQGEGKGAGKGAGKTDGKLLSTKLSWRVVTRRGVERPGLIAGAYADPTEWQVAPQKGSARATLVGQTASLKLEAPAGQDAAKLARTLAGLELIARTVVASR